MESRANDALTPFDQNHEVVAGGQFIMGQTLRDEVCVSELVTAKHQEGKFAWYYSVESVHVHRQK